MNDPSQGGAVPMHPRRSRWTSFVAEPSTNGPVRVLHERGHPEHRLRVEHDRSTLLIHLSGEGDSGWTTIAVDRGSRSWSVAQRPTQSDSSRAAYNSLYER